MHIIKVNDGIIDEEAFKKQKIRICFLLKQQTMKHYKDCWRYLRDKCTEGFSNDEWNLVGTTKYLIETPDDRYEGLYPELTQWEYVFLEDGTHQGRSFCHNDCQFLLFIGMKLFSRLLFLKTADKKSFRGESVRSRLVLLKLRGIYIAVIPQKIPKSCN